MAVEENTKYKARVGQKNDNEVTDCIMDVTHSMQLAALILLAEKYIHLQPHHERILGSVVATLLLITEKHWPGMGEEIIRSYKDPEAYKSMTGRDKEKMN
jgi:hypothetical protein